MRHCAGSLTIVHGPAQMTENWSKVEEKYVNDPFFAYRTNGEANDSLLPAELILKLIAQLDVIVKGLMNKLQVVRYLQYSPVA